MIQDPTRVERFTAEIADMKLPDTSSSRDRTLLRVGVALMVVGVVMGVVAYVIGHGTTNPLQQRDAIVIALIGLTVAVVGAAVFVRYSIAQFLRFWLARLSMENQAQTDRVVEAVRRD
jgi:magnesium-transporting ATPase (P-type)